MNPDLTQTETTPTPKKRGLACISPERRREIAQKGGYAAFAKGVTRLFDADSGRAAGRLGGMPKHRSPRRSSKMPPIPDDREVEVIVSMD